MGLLGNEVDPVDRYLSRNEPLTEGGSGEYKFGGPLHRD